MKSKISQITMNPRIPIAAIAVQIFACAMPLSAATVAATTGGETEQAKLDAAQ
jgi:hypothetical protein